MPGLKSRRYLVSNFLMFSLKKFVISNIGMEAKQKKFLFQKTLHRLLHGSISLNVISAFSILFFISGNINNLLKILI